MKTESGIEWTVGTDTEAAIYHQGTSQFIPATIYNTKGEKGNAQNIINPEGTIIGTYHRDNIGVEFQTHPASHAEEFYDAVRNIIDVLSQQYSDSINARLSYRPIARYKDPKMFMVPEACELGCESDYCAYSGEEVVEKPDVELMDKFYLRPFSGHLHTGYPFANKEAIKLYIKWCDIYIGLTQAEEEMHCWGDTGAARRKFYGQAGRFRYKPYGVEYRTPSSNWVGSLLGINREEGIGEVWTLLDQMNAALGMMERGKAPEDYGLDMPLIRGAIDGQGIALDAVRYGDKWIGQLRPAFKELEKLPVDALRIEPTTAQTLWSQKHVGYGLRD